MVMCAFGKAARTAIGNQDMSIEAAVVGIVDRVDINDTLLTRCAKPRAGSRKRTEALAFQHCRFQFG